MTAICSRRLRREQCRCFSQALDSAPHDSCLDCTPFALYPDAARAALQLWAQTTDQRNAAVAWAPIHIHSEWYQLQLRIFVPLPSFGGCNYCAWTLGAYFAAAYSSHGGRYDCDVHPDPVSMLVKVQDVGVLVIIDIVTVRLHVHWVRRNTLNDGGKGVPQFVVTLHYPAAATAQQSMEAPRILTLPACMSLSRPTDRYMLASAIYRVDVCIHPHSEHCHELLVRQSASWSGWNLQPWSGM